MHFISLQRLISTFRSYRCMMPILNQVIPGISTTTKVRQPPDRIEQNFLFIGI